VWCSGASLVYPDPASTTGAAKQYCMVVTRPPRRSQGSRLHTTANHWRPCWIGKFGGVPLALSE
jgi:hypothetical protein